MSRRTCDKCGKDKPLEAGMTCGKGHFVCQSCGRAPVSPTPVPVEGRRPATGKAYDHKHCPLCGHTLR